LTLGVATPGGTNSYAFAYAPAGSGVETGNLTGVSVSFANGATAQETFAHEIHGRTTQVTETVGSLTLSTSYSYYAGGKLATMTYPSGMQLSYTLDTAGRVSQVNANGVPLVHHITYQPFGPMKGWVGSKNVTPPNAVVGVAPSTRTDG